MDIESNPNPFSFVAEFDGEAKDIYSAKFDSLLCVLPLRDLVLFPGVIVPISIRRSSSVDLVRDAFARGTILATGTQVKPELEVPAPGDFFSIGVAARVVRIFDMPDDTITAIVQGLSPIRLERIERVDGMLYAHVKRLHERIEETVDNTYEILRQTVRDRLLEYIQLDDQLGGEVAVAVNNAFSMQFFINFACSNFPTEVANRIMLLEDLSPLSRGTRLLRLIAREMQFARIRHELHTKTQADIDNQQREYFLQQQLNNIRQQLGNSSDGDTAKLRKMASELKWPEEVANTFNHELEKMERLNPQSPDYQVQYNYLETMVQLPWGIVTEDNLSLQNAERVLRRDHYGLKDVKERILEHLAVRQMHAGKQRSAIICLYGPPGVGKTSLCRSIAEALKRKYVRASLGGLHDEAEIRGHRRTYIGAMPGRIIKSLIKAGTSNPVFVLDEIDKVTENTHNGDPASALLEVLDPEQNTAFHDNFLDVDFDLSQVMFIATANNVGAIPRPLLDRMELIEVNGYITEEKVEIARRHLIPRVMERCGIKGHKELRFHKSALEFLIERYTRESGVRGLEKELDRFFRKMVLHFERHGEFPALHITSGDIESILGKPKFLRDSYQGNAFAGVVTGLAWTSVGGEILFIETSLSRGKGQKLTLTGNLGDVMKESAVLALEYIKAHAETLGVDMRIFDHYNIHIHVPEGAVPKDGPSAGVTMATSLVSALTQRKVRDSLAMTGEITLRGKVLPVGGIKEKILAAKRAGIKNIVLCEDNRKDIEEIDELYLRGLQFHYVETIGDVIDFALLDSLVDKPIHFNLEDEKEQKS